MANDYLFTSESVSEGHPDKVCDQISDAVLDACLAQDPDAHVACETAVGPDFVVNLGEFKCRNRDQINTEAIARAVVNRPAILLADEPTANLDSATAADLLDIFAAFHQVGVTVVIATHDPQWMARLSPRVLRLERGRLCAA